MMSRRPRRSVSSSRPGPRTARASRSAVRFVRTMRCATVPLAYEERARDLRCRQPAEQAQRQRDATASVARHEDEPQDVVDLRDEIGLVELLEDLQLACDQILGLRKFA